MTDPPELRRLAVEQKEAQGILVAALGMLAAQRDHRKARRAS